MARSDLELLIGPIERMAPRLGIETGLHYVASIDDLFHPTGVDDPRLLQASARVSAYDDSVRMDPGTYDIAAITDDGTAVVYTQDEGSADRLMQKAIAYRGLVDSYLDSEMGNAFASYATANGGRVKPIKAIGAVNVDDLYPRMVAGISQAEGDYGELVLSERFSEFVERDAVQYGISAAYIGASYLTHEFGHLYFSESDEKALETRLVEFYTEMADKKTGEESRVYRTLAKISKARIGAVDKNYRKRNVPKSKAAASARKEESLEEVSESEQNETYSAAEEADSPDAETEGTAVSAAYETDTDGGDDDGNSSDTD
ncbi:MAG: hypothetical protein ABIC95_06930 [archaeon]